VDGDAALCIAFARRLFPAAVFTSRVLIALQVLLLAVTAMQADPEARARWEGTPESVFELSSRQNVFHFVLDGFQSDAFHDILKAERAEMDRQFSGFTFFSNHLGAFPTTIVSIPAMLTGSAYRNEEPMRRFIAKQFRRASLFGVMRAQGYQVDAVSGLMYDKASATTYYRLPTPYVTYENYTRFTGWQLADLALFRTAARLETVDLQRPVLAAPEHVRAVCRDSRPALHAGERPGVHGRLHREDAGRP
jgi:hypothetical protein